MRALVCHRHGPVEDVVPGELADAPAPPPHEVTTAIEQASVSQPTKPLSQGG